MTKTWLAGATSGGAQAERRTLRKAALFLGLLLFFQGLVSAQTKRSEPGQPGRARSILILNEVGPWAPAIAAIDHEIVAYLSRLPYHVEFYIENQDTTFFSDETSQREIRDWYFRKYRDRQLDLIVAVGPTPTSFMAESHAAFSPGTPIVFFAYDVEFGVPVKLDTDFTGVWIVIQPDDTLDAALALQPSTKHVVVVGGASAFDHHIQALVKQRLRGYESKVDFTYLVDLPMSDLLERLRLLASNTIVLHAGLMQDGAGRHFIDATQSVPMIAKAAAAPVFVMDDIAVGNGAVGGDVFSYSLTGRLLAEMAGRILNGEKPHDIPILEGASIPMYDWHAMQRWGLKASDLSPGSILLNREPTAWESYKKYIVAIVAVILGETLLIFALLWNRARRREAQRDLARSNETVRESEERFRLVANTAPVMIWMSGPDKQCTYFNQPWLDFTGREVEAELGEGWAGGVHPEDLSSCLDTYTGAFDRRESFNMQYRLRRHDGEYCWVLDLGVPRFNQDGSFAGYIGSCLDVTDRKLAEEALSGIGRRLIEAHEEERSWIARELHDDINQRIALLTIELERCVKNLPQSSESNVHTHFGKVRQGLHGLGNDIQALSHRLHSSKLDYLGLAAAANSFCKELSEQHQIEIRFRHSGIPVDLPKEVSLCLFRVLQEALQNAVKYSGEKQVGVELQGSSGEIQMTVSDLGVGFNQLEAANQRGLGLTSMRERVQLVGGEFLIQSQPGQGTTICVRTPRKTEEHRVRVAS